MRVEQVQGIRWVTRDTDGYILHLNYVKMKTHIWKMNFNSQRGLDVSAGANHGKRVKKPPYIQNLKWLSG